jgi:hypothetical protein
MQVSHHHAQLTHAARERDLIRLRDADGLLGRLSRSLRRR